MKKRLAKKFEKKEKGITLVALVVTIVVLLILAGITIMYVFGDNSVFKKTSDAKVKTEIGKIEERAQMIYSDKLLENAGNSLNAKVETGQVIEQLKSEGYAIKQRAVSAEDITGISLDKETMTIGTNKIVEIKVNYEGAEEPLIYYVEVNEKYYQIHSNKGFITIDREPSDLTKDDFGAEGGEGSNNSLTVTSSKTEIATAKVKENSNNIIEITSTETEGETIITVKYGSYEKKCTVKVVKPILATEMNLNAKFGFVTGGKSWINDMQLKVNLKPDNVTEKEVTWKSSDESVATVDNNGLVKATAEGKGGDIKITATTKDGSSLSVECTIRVEMFGAINSANTEYVDNSSQEKYKTVTIPKDYAVGTSDNINKIDKGLVIQDNDGNQFVWVPVDETAFSKMIDEENHRGILYNFSESGISPIAYPIIGFREPDSLTAEKYDNKASNFADAGITNVTNAETFKIKLQSEFNSMESSVKHYHGFFIGRYETGNLEANSTNVPVVQRGNIKINNVNWYYMYAQGERIAKNNSVVSSMIWGCQWDRTLDWIVAKNGGDYSLVMNSTSWGNHGNTVFEYLDMDGTTKEKNSDIVIPTGSTQRNQKNNIYDMAGNVWDWTAEAGNTDMRWYRRRSLL